MRVSVFGHLGVEHADAPDVALAVRPRALLALLAARHGRVVGVDELVEELWPDGAPKSARTALQGYVLAVRDALEPERERGGQGRHLRRDGNGYRLVVEPEELDLAEFQALADLARPRSEAVLDRMIDLSSEPIFQASADAQWALEIRASVAEARVDALRERFEFELSVASGADVLVPLRSARNEFPFDERIAGMLMLALYRNGRQQDALEVFSGIRRQLVDDLGMSPSQELDDLYVQILNHDVALDAPATTQPVALASSSGLVGRDDDIAAITDAILSERVVTVVGPGGIGKSSVAAEVVFATTAKFESALVVDAAHSVSGHVANEVAAAFGVDRHPMVSLGQLVDAELGGGPALLVIDTCEVATADVVEVVDEMLLAAGVHILLTSRMPTGHPMERQYRLQPLGLDDAVALLRRSDIRGDGSLSDDGLRRIAERLDRLPLALSIASPKVVALGADLVLEQVHTGRLHVEGTSERDGIERHQSLDSLVGWSLDLLGDAELSLLGRLAAVRQGVPVAALTDLPPLADLPVAAVADTLAALVDASLVVRESSSLDGSSTETFRLLDVVATAVESRFADVVHEQREIVSGHVTIAAWGDYTGRGPAVVGGWIPTQYAASLDHLAEAPDARGVMLATAAARTWLDRGSIDQGRRVLERALQPAVDLAPPLSSIAWAILGFNQIYQGDLRAARRSYRRAAETASSVPMAGTQELMDQTVAWLDCEFERAWEIASSAIEMMTTTNRRSPSNLLAFGKSALFAGDLEGAADCYERARCLAVDLGDRVSEANALRLAGVVASLQGDHDRAWRWAQQSLVLHDESVSPLGAAQTASSMALIAMLSADEQAAAQWSRTAIERARRQFDVQTVTVVLPVVAALDVRADRFERATQLYGWLDAYLDRQQHVHHPTADELRREVTAALATVEGARRRRWSSSGAALGAVEVLHLAAS